MLDLSADAVIGRVRNGHRQVQIQVRGEQILLVYSAGSEAVIFEMTEAIAADLRGLIQSAEDAVFMAQATA